MSLPPTSPRWLHVVSLTALLMATAVGAAAAQVERSVALRAESDLEDLARAAARMLRRRGVRVSFAGVGPPAEAEAADTASVRVDILRRHGRAHVRIGGRTPDSPPLQLALQPSDPGAPWALALAVESFLEAPPPRRAAVSPRSGFGSAPPPPVAPPSGPEARRPQRARPTVYLRWLTGWSFTRRSALIGPGAGLGLCVGEHCAVVEAELPVLANETGLDTGQTLRYRAVTASARLQFRPLRWRSLALGWTLGLFTRIGTANLVGSAVRQSVSSLGGRMSVEVAWRFAGPFEWVLEAGADLVMANSRARAHAHGRPVYVEDRWTPWLVAALRIRPRAEAPEPRR